MAESFEPAQQGIGPDDGAARLLSDDPIEGAGEDTLGRVPLADRIIDLLAVVRKETPTAVVGLLGSWGSGKTSLLNLVRERMRDREFSWRVVDFNPWFLTDTEALLREFFAVLMNGITSNRWKRKLKRQLAKYGAAVGSWLRVVSVPGLDVGRAAEQVATVLGRLPTIETSRRQLEALLEKHGNPVLVVVDDIDRLDPAELTMVFKLIRLVGRLPGIYYLVAFDEDTALDILAASDVGHGDLGRAHAYLEKIVQVRIDIPSLHQAAASKLVDGLLASTLAITGVELEEVEDRRFSEIYWRHLASRMLQPRQIRRLFAQVHATLPLVDGEVNVVDFIVLTYLRTQYPRLFRALRSERDSLTDSLHGAVIQRMQSTEDRSKAWRDFVQTHVSDADVAHVIGLLAAIFPPVRVAVEGAGQPSEQGLAAARRAASVDYFDRYFQFGVPSDDVSDSAVAEALTALAAGTQSWSEDWLRTQALEHRGLVLKKMQSVWRAQPTDATLRLIRLLAAIYPGVHDFRGELTSPSRLIELWVGQLLGEQVVAPEDVATIADMEDGLRLLTRALSLRFRLARQDGQTVADPLDALAGEVATLLDEKVRTAAARPVSENDGLPWLLYYSRDFRPADNVTQLLQSILDNSAWSTSDFVGCFMSIGQSAYNPERFLSGFAADELFALVPVDEIFRRLDAQLRDVELDDVRQPSEDPDISFPHRVRRALAALRTIRAQYDSQASG